MSSPNSTTNDSDSHLQNATSFQQSTPIVQSVKSNKSLDSCDTDSEASDHSLPIDAELYMDLVHGKIHNILESGVDLSKLKCKEDGNSVLHVAACAAQPQLIRDIIPKCKDIIKSKNCYGETVFHCAVKSARIDTLNALMDWNKYEVDQSISNSVLAEQDKEGNTALHIALEYNQNIMAYCLVGEYPKACYVLNNKYISPLYMAVENRNLRLVEHMMSCIRQLEYLEPDFVDQLLSGWSLVHAAIETGKIDILKEILENGAEAEAAELVNLLEDGQTPLSYAAYKGHLNIVQYFLDKFPKMAYKRNDDGSFPIHRACSGGYVNVLKALHSTRHLLNKQGQNILHVAATEGKADVVSYLLKVVELKRLVNLKDNDGNTPLHLAAKGFHPRVVYILTCEPRVKNEIRNKDGLTALDVAEIHSDLPISFEAKLTWITLKYINSPRSTLLRRQYFAEKQRYMNSQCSSSQSPQQNNSPLQSEKLGNPKVDQEPFKKSSDTIMLVSTLVATVTFAAGFTVPGSYNQNNPNIGMAVLINKWAFQAFVICNTAALFTSILSALCLVWVQLKNLKLMLLSYNLAQALLGFALAMMWLAFTMGLFVVLGNLPWLSYVVLGMAFLFMVVALLVFIPLVSSSYIRNSVVRFLFRGPFLLLLLACEKSSVKYD